jgi:hypothetical protein
MKSSINTLASRAATVSPLLFLSLCGSCLFPIPAAYAQGEPPQPPQQQQPQSAPPAETPPAAEPPVTSSSPVPATSGLYPGSTVRRFSAKDNFGFESNFDLRYRDSSREDNGVYLASGRLTADWVRANPANRDERGGVRLQLLLETDSKGTVIESFRFSEAYAYYTFLSGGVSARARAGQFVLPFGLIAVYDTPLQPIQPLYAHALGLRVDTGLMLEGRWGPYQFAGSITTGAGPNRSDFDGNKTVSFRLGRSVQTPYGALHVGGSLLTGRMPVTTFDTELPPSGTSGARDFVDKTRFAVDGQFGYGRWLGRGELIFGADAEDEVFGYFVEANYELADRVTLVGYSKRWDFPDKPQRFTSMGLGVNYQFGRGFVARGLFEYQREVPLSEQGNPFVTKRFTIQTQLTF